MLYHTPRASICINNCTTSKFVATALTLLVQHWNFYKYGRVHEQWLGDLWRFKELVEYFHSTPRSRQRDDLARVYLRPHQFKSPLSCCRMLLCLRSAVPFCHFIHSSIGIFLSIAFFVLYSGSESVQCQVLVLRQTWTRVCQHHVVSCWPRHTHSWTGTWGTGPDSM